MGVISASRPPAERVEQITEPEDAGAVPDGCLIQHRNILLRPVRGSTQVLVLFNGALDKARLRAEPVFQRRSWSGSFAATLAFVCDPGTDARTGLQIGWYAGTGQAPVLPELHDRIRRLTRAVHGRDLPVTAFGSSAGGFAALMSWVQGYSARAIAINPQTSILRYHAPLRDAFLDYYGKQQDTLDGSDLCRLSVLETLSAREAAPSGRAHILQNIPDRHHYEGHFVALLKHHSSLPDAKRPRISFEVMHDAVAQHLPPSRERTLSWLRDCVPELLHVPAPGAAA